MLLLLTAFAADDGFARTARIRPGDIGPQDPQAWYQMAMLQCRSQYMGARSAPIDAMRPMMIENCFKQKTGKFPWQAGVTIFPTQLRR